VRNVFTVLVVIVLILGIIFKLHWPKVPPTNIIPDIVNNLPILASPTPTPVPTLPPIPQNKIISNNYHVFQTFNNCGPAALSMALSYYGINMSQYQLGQDLRPYQNSIGDNDDKSVTLSELANKSIEFGFTPFHRPNGTTEIIKQFIANDIPVITRTLLKPNEDIGHYRVVKGYNDTAGEFTQDDSLQGKNLQYTYSSFNELWKTFNYEYLVLVPAEKLQIAKNIIGKDVDEVTSWKKFAVSAQKNLETNPEDLYTRFNLSVALYHTGDFRNSVLEFEKVENKLPLRTLWYQIEPIKSYYELGDYQRVLSITEKILNNQNRAFSELYVIRGRVFEKQGKTEQTKQEFDKATFYNKNLRFEDV